ncbi:MAG: AAA family ATPase [Solirubrobacteraceae bacterium MAG38_C4-C5]|nr:AAA family ATPase [Candidatus Siliceabacter maunaloa]
MAILVLGVLLLSGLGAAALIPLVLIAAAVSAVRGGVIGLLRTDAAVLDWRRQAAAERAMPARLASLPPDWVVLHDRQLPDRPSRFNIDHLLVGPAGAFVVIAVHDAGAANGYGHDVDATVGALREADVLPMRTVIVAQRGVRGDGWETDNGVPVKPAGAVVGWLTSQPALLDARETRELVERALARFPSTGAPAPAFQPQHGQGPGSDAVEPAPLAPLVPAPESSDDVAVDIRDPERLNRVLAELDDMPGLGSVAEQVRSMARRLEIDQQRLERGMATSSMGVHAVFSGPPGTGKTTVARVWGRVLAALGRLPSGHVVETDRSGLVGEYVGHTAQRTQKKVDEALGGILFVDEAYALASDYSQDFGHEAITTLLARMENEREQLCVIVAGYEAEMERFLEANPGLGSRFDRHVTFPELSAPALVMVAERMARRDDYHLDDDAREVLLGRLRRLTASPPKHWANARSVRQILDVAISCQADRLVATGEAHGREALEAITADDVTAALDRRYPQG